MMAKRLDGRRAADQVLQLVHRRVRQARRPIRLATILVGQRYDSTLYVKLKLAAAQRVGIRTEQHHLPERTSQRQLENLIRKLNHQKSVGGILLQLPLPKHLNADHAVATIDPDKDADGFHLDNTRIVPPPVAAVLKLITLGHPPKKSRVVILGRQSVYTKQLQTVFEKKGWSVAIRSSRWMADTKKADVIVTALGRGPKLQVEQVSRRAIIVDVGIRHEHGKTAGDVDSKVWQQAKAISPVPGGVGPLTVAYLLYNTVSLTTRL